MKRNCDEGRVDGNRNAGCRFLRGVIQHCSRCAAKTELCVTVISFEALVSFDSKVFTACPAISNAVTASKAYEIFRVFTFPKNCSALEVAGFSRRPVQPLFESGDSKAMNFSLERR